MYIRRTRTRNTDTGERYFTHRAVRSERVGGKVRRVTLLNLGRHFTVAQADRPTLCARIEEILSGQAVLLGGRASPLVEREAQRPAAQLLAREGAAAPADVHSIVVDSLQLSRPRTVGVDAVGLWGCGAVGLWGCGAVGLWGCGAVGDRCSSDHPDSKNGRFVVPLADFMQRKLMILKKL